jgi:LCP family protein required for cell wall assembly
MLVAACSADAEAPLTLFEEDTTTSAAPTTTTPPTTTTTAPMEFSGTENDPGLEALVRDLYESDERTETSAQAAIGQFDEETQVAVVEAGDDVTLAVADPNWRLVGGWWPSINEEPSLGTFPKFVLVIGSDARPGHDPLGALGDSLHIVAMDGTGASTILGLPRDSWIDVPGYGNQKATNSLLKGGPELVVESISNLTEIEFDGYLLTAFEGFTGLIDVLGGLDIDVPISMADKWSKAYLDAGRQILSATDALAFVRTRKTISGGDFTRKKHGGMALAAAASMVRGMGMGAVPALMEMSSDLYFTDMSAEDALLLTASIVAVDPNATTIAVAPGYVDTTSGGASIVRLYDEAYEVFEDVRTDGSLDNPPEG